MSEKNVHSTRARNVKKQFIRVEIHRDEHKKVPKSLPTKIKTAFFQPTFALKLISKIKLQFESRDCDTKYTRNKIVDYTGKMKDF